MTLKPILAIAAFAALALALPAHAADLANAAPSSGSAIPGALDRAFGQIAGAQSNGSLSLSLQLLLIMGLLTILPSLVLMMTSFTRILVVLAILRQALGLQQSPPNQVDTSKNRRISACRRREPSAARGMGFFAPPIG